MAAASSRSGSSTTGSRRRHRNEVVLVGELETAPTDRELKTGDPITTFRLGVARDADAEGSRESFDCTVIASRARRSCSGWDIGDVVEVTGMLRRRFYRAGAASRPFVVIEVDRARRVAPR
jgi:single-strand DNA-binding protein